MGAGLLLEQLGPRAVGEPLRGRPVTCAVFTRPPTGWRHVCSGQPVKNVPSPSRLPLVVRRGGGARGVGADRPDALRVVVLQAGKHWFPSLPLSLSLSPSLSLPLPLSLTPRPPLRWVVSPTRPHSPFWVRACPIREANDVPDLAASPPQIIITSAARRGRAAACRLDRERANRRTTRLLPAAQLVHVSEAVGFRMRRVVARADANFAGAMLTLGAGIESQGGGHNRYFPWSAADVGELVLLENASDFAVEDCDLYAGSGKLLEVMSVTTRATPTMRSEGAVARRPACETDIIHDDELSEFCASHSATKGVAWSRFGKRRRSPEWALGPASDPRPATTAARRCTTRATARCGATRCAAAAARASSRRTTSSTSTTTAARARAAARRSTSSASSSRRARLLLVAVVVVVAGAGCPVRARALDDLSRTWEPANRTLRCCALGCPPSDHR